ncbi:MAG: hypothetical protein WB988_00830 [Candidatus Nitrosopolaris sp.]
MKQQKFLTHDAKDSKKTNRVIPAAAIITASVYSSAGAYCIRVYCT